MLKDTDRGEMSLTGLRPGTISLSWRTISADPVSKEHVEPGGSKDRKGQHEQSDRYQHQSIEEQM